MRMAAFTRQVQIAAFAVERHAQLAQAVDRLRVPGRSRMRPWQDRSAPRPRPSYRAHDRRRCRQHRARQRSRLAPMRSIRRSASLWPAPAPAGFRPAPSAAVSPAAPEPMITTSCVCPVASCIAMPAPCRAKSVTGKGDALSHALKQFDLCISPRARRRNDEPPAVGANQREPARRAACGSRTSNIGTPNPETGTTSPCPSFPLSVAPSTATSRCAGTSSGTDRTMPGIAAIAARRSCESPIANGASAGNECPHPRRRLTGAAIPPPRWL